MPINYREYHPKWSLISRLIRFRRAENRCEWCGAENYQPHPITGSKVVLTVAHIDRDKNNNRFSNLAALCQRCHLLHDRWQHAENRKYGRHWKRAQLKLDL
jgi:5-methylcytosine-specific restriction endonuclease McrA